MAHAETSVASPVRSALWSDNQFHILEMQTGAAPGFPGARCALMSNSVGCSSRGDYGWIEKSWRTMVVTLQHMADSKQGTGSLQCFACTAHLGGQNM